MASNSFLHIDVPLGSNGASSSPQPSLTADVLPPEACGPAQSPFRSFPGNTGQVVFSQHPPPSTLTFIFFCFQHLQLSSRLLPLQPPLPAMSLPGLLSGASFLLFLPPPQAACPCLKFRLFSGSPICCSLGGPHHLL